VAALQTSITDIGDGRATTEAQQILSRDPDPTVIQIRPVALAVLLPTVLKWLIVILVGLVIATALGQPAMALVLVGIAAVALLGKYGPLSATEYKKLPASGLT
jgi:hypothetical protein